MMIKICVDKNTHHTAYNTIRIPPMSGQFRNVILGNQTLQWEIPYGYEWENHLYLAMFNRRL